MTLIFEDTFVQGVDDAIWTARTNLNKSGWNRLENVIVEPPILQLRVVEEEYLGEHYTSAEILTRDKFEFTYGTTEIRAQVPSGQGLWSGLWLMGEGLGYRYEPDFELLGRDSHKWFMTHHWREWSNWEGQVQATHSGPDYSLGFHIYTIDWKPDAVIWHIDGIERFRVVEHVPDKPMWLIMSLIVGGTWGGEPDETTVFPSYLDVDYVRVTQDPGLEANMWHGYIGIEDLVLNPIQRQTFIRELRRLGPRSNAQPARLCHWRTRPDNEAVIFEALFNEDNLTVARFKQRLGAIFGVDPATIDHATQQASFAGSTTPIVTFSRSGTDYLRFALFGGTGAAWMESGDECRGYLAVNWDEWK